jgi:hypothetical protein
MRNCKTPMMVEAQSADCAAIHDMKKGPSPYPPGACTPLKIGRGPPCDEAVTIVGEYTPFGGRRKENDNNHR